MTRKVKPEKYKDIPAAIIRNRSKQQVDTVFFPNSVVIKPKLKVIGVLQTTEILNAGEVREAGVPITPASFLFTPDIMLIKADSESLAEPDRNTDFIDLVTAYGFNREVEFLGYGNTDSHLTKPFSYVNVLNQFTASANSGKPLYPGNPQDVDGTLLSVTGSSGSISFYTETEENRANNLDPDNFLALKLEFEKNNSEDVTYRCLFLKQYLSGTDSTEHTSGVKPLPQVEGVSVQEKLRSVNLSNPFIIKGKSQTVNINRSFTVKKLEPGDKGEQGGPGEQGPPGAEGPIFSLSPNPQPVTLNSDPGGSVTLSPADKSTISGQISGSQLTYVEPSNSDESVNPTSDLNFSIDFGKNNIPTADFVDLSGNVTTISGADSVYDFANKTLTFSKDGTDRLQLTITKSANNDCEALVTVASKDISSNNYWVSCTVNLDAYINRNGQVNPEAPGFQIPIQIVKNIPITTTVVDLSKETINIATDYLGRHPTEKKQYDSYDNSSSDDNVPTSAFTTITVKAGETDLTFDGHQEPGEEPSVNTYRIDTKNVVMKTVGPVRSDGNNGTLTEMTLNNNLRVHNVTYPGGGNPSSTDPSTGDVDYHLWGNSALNGNVVFGVFIDKDSNNNAKISVSLLDYTDGETNNTNPAESNLFDSVEVSIPVVINSNGRIENVVKALTVSKIKSAPPTPVVSLTKDLISIPTDHLGRNPTDGTFFDSASDFPSNARNTILSVTAGNTSLTWHGEENDSTPTDPPESQFRINPMGITGTTNNGVSLTPRSISSGATALDSPPATDVIFDINFANQESVEGHVLRLRSQSDGLGGVNIQLFRLAEFDNSTSGDFTTGGTQRFDSIDLTIPVKATIAGVTNTINKTLTISKSKEVRDPVVSITRDTFSVPADHNASNNGGTWSSASLSSFKTVISVSQGGDSLTWDGDKADIVPAFASDPGKFKLNTRAATATTENGATIEFAESSGMTNASPNDKDYEIRYKNSTSGGQIFRLDINEDSSGNPEITLFFLEQHDDAPTDSSQFINLNVTIPVLITKFDGTTVTENVVLEINKIKDGDDGTPGADAAPTLFLDLDSNVAAFSDSSSTSPNPSSVTATITQSNQASNVGAGEVTISTGGTKGTLSKTVNPGIGTGVYTMPITLPTSQANYPFTITVTNDNLTSTKKVVASAGGDTPINNLTFEVTIDWSIAMKGGLKGNNIGFLRYTSSAVQTIDGFVAVPSNTLFDMSVIAASTTQDNQVYAFQTAQGTAIDQTQLGLWNPGDRVDILSAIGVVRNQSIGGNITSDGYKLWASTFNSDVDSNPAKVRVEEQLLIDGSTGAGDFSDSNSTLQLDNGFTIEEDHCFIIGFEMQGNNANECPDQGTTTISLNIQYRYT